MAPRDFLQISLGFVLGVSTCAGVAMATTPMDRVLGLLAEARHEVRAIDEVAEHARERWVRQRIHTHASRLDGQLTALQQLAYTTARPPPPPPVEVIPAAPVVYTVTDAELAQLIGALRTESFSKGRLAMLGDVVRDRWFTSHQVVQLLGEFTFSSDKVEAAARLYPHVVDPQSWYVVYGAFTFSADKEALRSRLGL